MRDLTVTGVQTCALPISQRHHDRRRLARPALRRLLVRLVRDCGAGRLLAAQRSEEHTSELQSQSNLVCRLLLEKKKQAHTAHTYLLLTHSTYTTIREHPT